MSSPGLHRLPPWFLSLLLGFGIGLIAALLVFFLDLSYRAPAEFLPAASVRLFLEQRGSGDTLSRFVSPPKELPAWFSDAGGERALALLEDERGGAVWLAFAQLPSSFARRRELRREVAVSPEMLLLGKYMVWGSRDPRTVLIPRGSSGALALDPLYRTRDPGEHMFPERLFLRPAPPGHPAVTLPSFLRDALEGSPVAEIAALSHGGGMEFTVTTPLPPDSGDASPLLRLLPRLPDDTHAPLRFGFEGRAPAHAFAKALRRFAGASEDSALILRGAAEAQFARVLSAMLDLPSFLALFGDGPFAFVAREGGAGETSWLFAGTVADVEGVDSMLREITDEAAARMSPTVIRERVLPSGRKVRDILAAPGKVQRKEITYRGYRLSILRSAPFGSGAAMSTHELAFARRGDVLLLGNAEVLLRAGIDALQRIAGAQAALSVPQGALGIAVADAAFLRSIVPLLPEEGGAEALHSFLPLEGKLLWYRERRGAFSREVFRVEQESPGSGAP